jgi:rubredoxin
MDFPIVDLMDEQACYDWLVKSLHPKGLCCPDCGEAKDLGVHRRHRDPILDWRCKHCGHVFNAFSGTVFQATQRSSSKLVLILRGIAQGMPTAQLARELKCSRWHLLELRHQLQANAQAAVPRGRLKDLVVEADEMFQNAGEKRETASRPGRPAAKAGQ